MVYPKKRSGDPDLDDKQPPEFHQGGAIVSAGDGVFITEAAGVVDANGAHVNLAVDTEDLDNRPAPGEQATKPSSVQDYDSEDLGVTKEAKQADVGRIADAQHSVFAASPASEQEAPARAETPKQAPAGKSNTGK